MVVIVKIISLLVQLAYYMSLNVRNPNVRILALFFLVQLSNLSDFEQRLKSEQFHLDFERSVDLLDQPSIQICSDFGRL